MYAPAFRGRPAERTEIRVAYDGQYLLRIGALLRFATGRDTVDDRLGLNFRVRCNFRGGSDLWVVYDEGFNTERDAGPGEPRLPLSQSRVPRVKLTRTFTP